MTDSHTEWNRNDRDLLVELRTEMRGVRSDMKNISDGNNSRLLLLEQGKLDRTEFNRLQSESLNVHTDHETRIRGMEKGIDTLSTQFKTWLIAGGVLLTVIQIVVQILLAVVFHI